jgi:hypothetical protein
MRLEEWYQTIKHVDLTTRWGPHLQYVWLPGGKRHCRILCNVQCNEWGFHQQKPQRNPCCGWFYNVLHPISSWFQLFSTNHFTTCWLMLTEKLVNPHCCHGLCRWKKLPPFKKKTPSPETIIWLVVLSILKNISHWEGLSHILWKIKNVWNHQPDKGSRELTDMNGTIEWECNWHEQGSD